MFPSNHYLPHEKLGRQPFKRLQCRVPSIRIYHNGPRRFGNYQQRISRYPSTPAILLPATDLLCQTVSQAVKLARDILNSPSGIKALASLARALYALSPEDVRVIDPHVSNCRECLERSVQDSVSTPPVAKETAERVFIENPPRRLLPPIQSSEVIDDGCQGLCELNADWGQESWDRQAAKQYVSLVTAEWPDVLIDETLQWPTNFANVERRPWGHIDHDDAGFAPHKFLVSLNAARIHSMHECGPEDMCRYMFQLVVTMVHEVGGHLFVTYLTRGRAHTPRAMRHPNYFPTIYEGAPESGRFLELALFGGALVFAGDGSNRFQQSGIPYLVAPDGLARRVEPQAMCETITGATNFPLPTDGAELEYYRLPLLCGVDPELEEDIAQQEGERLSHKSQSLIEVVSPYSV